ncbi:type II secretion system protein [Pseudomonas sp. microsymbiont 2]
MTYFWFLFVVFLVTVGAGHYLDLQSRVAQRYKEVELIRLGEAYKTAIQAYYLSSPQGAFRYPDRLEELLHDRRHVVVRRYLRRLYLDPITARPFLPVPSENGGIAGVRSGSPTRPLAKALKGAQASVADPQRYSDWQFIYLGP